jgi:hypothetical protein
VAAERAAPRGDLAVVAGGAALVALGPWVFVWLVPEGAMATVWVAPLLALLVGIAGGLRFNETRKRQVTGALLSAAAVFLGVVSMAALSPPPIGQGALALALVSSVVSLFGFAGVVVGRVAVGSR